MSIFRPPKTKPRQFNYIPRYYDPVKEERNHRRKLLHGTSTESDNEEYTPGKYVRTQREARDAVRESERSAGGSKLMSLMLITAVIAVGIMWLMPYIMEFVMAADEEKKAVATGVNKSATAENERVETPLDWAYNESIDPTILEGIETLTDKEKLKEAAESEWRHKKITIKNND
ncbi:MAG: hypothetical protein U0L61_07890 [Alistipes sp.]|nr:hypothetical protein [Alistipes sp.]